MRFKGLGLSFLAEIAREKGVSVPEPYGSGGDVKNWYDTGEYDNIVRHLESDLRVLRIIDLNHELLLRS